MAAHGSSIYYTLESYLKSAGENEYSPGTKEYNRFIRLIRRMNLRWNRWKMKHPSEPLVLRCAVCSGKEHKRDIKLGKWKISTREEQKQLKEETNEH